MKPRSLLALVSSVLFLTSFASADDEYRSLVEGNSTFALDVFHEVASQPGNVFFSPLSVSTALSMAQAGASGTTAEEMANVLHLPPQAAQKFAALNARLSEAQSQGKVELRVANSLWAHKDYPFLPAFFSLCENQYKARIEAADFTGNPEGERRKINGWVEEQTNEKIKDLIPVGLLNRLTRLVLANAIYFKGAWANKFREKETAAQPFFAEDGTKGEVPLMHQTGNFRFKHLGALRALELPYAGEKLSMVVLLPRERGQLKEIESSLSASKLKEWIGELEQTPPASVSVFLPSFKVEHEIRLDNVLKQLGMRKAFNQAEADFSNMSSANDLFISAVLHKAFVEVNEEGTEAAAATAAIITMRSISIPPVFRADHPFLFLIRDKQTGAILFLGRFAGPKVGTRGSPLR